MRKIINNRSYDTDTAKELGSWSTACSASDGRSFSETLYQKRTGEFFLHGAGNPMSRYAERVDGSCWRCGEAITPLTYDRARQWAERHLDAEDYEGIFGAVSDDGDGDDTIVTLRLSAAVSKAIDREMAKTGRTKREIVNDILDKALL